MNGYICFYKGKRIEVWADSSYAAQQVAAARFRAKKSYEVTVCLAETPDGPTTHDGASLPGA